MHLAVGRNTFDFILLVLALFVLPAISAFTGRRIAKAPDVSLLPRYLQTMARGWLVVALVAGAWWWSGRPAAWLGFDVPVGESGLYGLLFVGIALVAMAIQVVRFDRLVVPERLPKLRQQIRDIKILPRTSAEYVVFLFVALSAGIWEELLYRGFLIWFLGAYLGVVPAVILSTAVFGLGHVYQGWGGVLRGGGLGLLFAIGYVASGSLWWLIALHALVDIFGGTMAWRVSTLRLPNSTSA
ncbi:MAG TPA: CPBP family intramembrane glutamic endopeptidase [Rhizomicrobium sp.]